MSSLPVLSSYSNDACPLQHVTQRSYLLFTFRHAPLPGVDADYVSVFDCCFSLITVIVNMSMCHLMLMHELLIVVVAGSSVFE